MKGSTCHQHRMLECFPRDWISGCKEKLLCFHYQLCTPFHCLEPLYFHQLIIYVWRVYVHPEEMTKNIQFPRPQNTLLYFDFENHLSARERLTSKRLCEGSESIDELAQYVGPSFTKTQSWFKGQEVKVSPDKHAIRKGLRKQSHRK